MKRSQLVVGALIMGVLVAGCEIGTPSDPEEADRDRLGIAMDKGKWNEGERTFTVDGKPYGIVSSDQVACSAKFAFIAGSGETEVDKAKSASFTLVAVVGDMEGGSAIPLKDLPQVFKDNARGLSKEKFEEIVQQTRGSNEALAAICGDI